MRAQYSFGTSGNPLVQALWIVLGAALLVGAFVMGAVVLTILFALGAVGAAVIAVRVWWLRRKLARAGAFDRARPGSESVDAGEGPPPRLIDAEYTVVAERDAPEARAAEDVDDGERGRSGRRVPR